MTLTAKQRAKIYRRAAEKVFKGTEFGCEALADIIGKGWVTMCDALELSPEFELFKPRIDDSRGGGWWPSARFNVKWSESNEPRILALLFSEQMALDSIKTKK